MGTQPRSPQAVHDLQLPRPRDGGLLDWIAESQISALVADNYAVEGLLGKDRDPSRHSFLPIHHLCLFQLGVPLGRCGTSTSSAAWLREHGEAGSC